MLSALVWNLLLTTALAVVLAGLCRLPALRRRPALKHWLWLLLLAKLVTPSLIAMPLLPAAVGTDGAASMVLSRGEPLGHEAPALELRRPMNLAAEDAAAIAPAPVAGRAGSQALGGDRRSLLFGGLLVVSLAGTCVLLTVQAGAAVRLFRRLRRAATENDLLSETCAQVASRLKIRRVVRSCVVDVRTTPLLCAWGRPMVVVPRQLLDELSPQQLRSIIAHELAHLVRRDHWANAFVLIVKALMWWNPVVWWADRELRAAQELCCDALAMEHGETDRRSYATTLLKALDFIQVEPLAPRALAAGMGSRATILRRFEMIGETRLSYKLSRGAILMLLVMLVPLICIPVRAQEQPAAPAAPAADKTDAAPEAAATDGKQEETAKKAATRVDEFPGLDPKIKELGEAVKKRMNDWSDEETLTLKEGETGHMKVKKNATPVEEILITPHFAEKGIKYGLKGLDAAGKTVAGTGTTSLAYSFNQPASVGLGKTFQVDGENIMSMIQLKATRQGDDGVVVKAKSLFMRVGTQDELEAMLLVTAGKRGRVMADFMKINRWIWEYRNTDSQDPKDLAELNKPLPKDYYSPTGEDYHYEVQRTRYILSSCGPDGIYGNDDDLIQVADHSRHSTQTGTRGSLYPLPEEKDADAEAETKPRSRPSKARAISQNGNETVIDVRPQGNCSISGKVVSETTGEPINNARMYLFYNVTHGSIFINAAKDGTFTFKDIPQGPFLLRSSNIAGYHDVSYDPEGKSGQYAAFSLSEGEQRAGIVLKAKPACQISGKVEDENGDVPKDVGTLIVLAWFKRDDGKTYESQQAGVNQSDGSYLIDGLSDKPAYVMAINWRAAKQGRAYPPIYYPGTFSRNEATLVTFDKSPLVEDINIKLRKEGGLAIEGTVRDEAGKPVPEAFVVVDRPDMLCDVNTTYTDDQGHYRIEGLGDGRFTIHVDAVHRGLVRVRHGITLDNVQKTTQHDVTLSRGVLISGKLVDEQGNDWPIAASYGNAFIVKEPPTEGRGEERGIFSLGDFRNKHRPQSCESGSGGTFMLGEGDYEGGEMIFTTESTFVIQGMAPGRTIMMFLPNKESQKVVKIMHDGQDIMATPEDEFKSGGIDTTPGQELKDMTIVIGKK